LFELDSTRRSPQEVEKGQSALIEEVIHNGNAVVLSYNQLIDSPGFIGLLQGKSYDAITEWFKAGALKVSPYSSAKTASEYLQQALAKKDFLSSALKLNKSDLADNALIEAMKRALQYGDFQQLKDQKSTTDAAMRRKCGTVINLVRLVLVLNLEEPSRSKPKAGQPASFADIMRTILDRCLPGYGDVQGQPAGPVRQTLEDILGSLSGAPRNDRSQWVQELQNTSNPDLRHLCELIVDLCYNYVVEDSMWGISKHYVSMGDDTFVADFHDRLRIYAAESSKNGHMYHSDGPADVPASDSPDSKRWHMDAWIMRAIQTASKRRDADLADESAHVQTYGHHYQNDRHEWLVTRRKELARHLLTLVGYTVGFVVLNELLSLVSSRVADVASFPVHGFLYSVIYSLILLVAFALVGSVLMKIFRLPDILDSVLGVGKALMGWRRIRRIPRDMAYRRKEEG